MGNAWLRCCVPAGRAVAGPDEDEDGCPGTNHVELAASELFTVPGFATAYHTSVIVNDEEFFFSDSGILWDRVLTSHQGKPSEIVDLGYSRHNGLQLLCVLQPYFAPSSYDLVRKNCNSFSDCALHFLLRKRLDKKYSALERLGQRASMTLLQRVTKGMYIPNQVAANFSVEGVISRLDQPPDAKEHTAVASNAAKSSFSRPVLANGASVTVVGLKNSEALNGQGAIVQRYNSVNGRWEARLNHTGEVKAFRAENLWPAGELLLQPGDAVRIYGLKSDTGQALNGLEGKVLRYLHDVSRYEVLVGGNAKGLKAVNLQLLASTGS